MPTRGDRRKCGVALSEGIGRFQGVRCARDDPYDEFIRSSPDARGGAAVIQNSWLIFDPENRIIFATRSGRMPLEDQVNVVSDDDVIAARQRGRSLAAEIGFSPTDQAMVAAIITELGRNLVDYAGGGELLFHAIGDVGRRGIAVVARDHGPGIVNIKEALQTSYSVAGGLGLGLRGVKGIVDSLDIVSVPGKGTTVTAHKWQS